MAYIPATPTAPLTNASALRKVVWSAKTRVQQVRPSVFANLKTEYEMNQSGEIVISRPGVVLDVTNEGVKGQGQSVRLALRTPLMKRPAYGTEDSLGAEDESTLKYGEIFYNETNKAVKMYERGYYANDVSSIKYNEGYNPLVNDFQAEMTDYFCHQALLLTYAENLTFAPVSKVFAFNKNFWIPNLTDSQQPTYDSTAQTTTQGAADSDSWYSTQYFTGATTFAENLGDALATAGGVASAPTNLMNTTAWSRLRNFVRKNKAVTPLQIDGIATYLCLVPTDTMSWMLNPANTGSIGEYFKTVNQYKGDNRDALPGEIGRVLGCFLLVEDDRAMTLTLGGTDGARTITPGYMLPGNNDDRNATAWSNTSGSTNYVHDIMLVLGQNAIAHYLRDDTQIDTEMTSYGRIKGVNHYRGEGWQLPFFDIDTSTDSSRVYEGSIVVPVGRAAA